MKILIIILTLTLNLKAAIFKFKDGTIIEGKIFENPSSIGNPSPEGVFLIVNNKFYVHNYPLKTKEKIIDHGNGTYTIVEETVPTPAPPPLGGLNPPQLPNCLPARINFIQFQKETLNNLYKYYAHKTKFHKAVIDKYPNAIDHRVAFEKNKSVAWGIYIAAHKKNFKINSPKLNADWNKKVRKEFSFNPMAFIPN
jgi:hypothetical protein